MRLLAQMPEQYARWLRVAMLVTVMGYLAVLSVSVWTWGVGVVAGLREPYVILIVLIALGVERTGRRRTAATLTFGALWVEAHLTFVDAGAVSSSAAVFPCLVMGVALFLGTRLAAFVAVSTVVTVPMALALRSTLTGLPFLGRGEVVYLVVLICSTLGSALVLTLFLRAFGDLHVHAERHAVRARELIDGAPDAILAINHLGIIEDCNPAAERLLARERGGLVGSSFFKLGLKEADSENSSSPPAFDTLKGAPREYWFEPRGLVVEGVLRTVTRADGQRGSLVVLRDITQRKQAERRAKELQHELQHSQKLEALGRLAGGVAHDFNNLLTAVGGYGDLLAKHSDRLVQGVAAELSAARARGSSLTNQLLAFARKEYAEPRGVDLALVISNMDRLLQQLLGERIQLQIEGAPGAVIHADPGQLQQVILNLVMNAKDAMPGGGTLTLSVRRWVSEGDVELEVRDTGVGMDEGTRERLFEPFFTTKPRGQGTGLGLSTVHGIIEASRGSIQVQSEIGRGTVFSLRWPAHSGIAEEPRSAIPPLRPASGSRGTVLLAEDDPQSRACLVQLLTDAGFVVHVAHDGEQGLSLYRHLREQGSVLDVLLSDVRMPKMTGVDLAARLRELDPSLPVLFISGYLEETLDESNFQRSSDLLLKPFTAEVLLARLDHKVNPAPPAHESTQRVAVSQ